MIWGGGIEFYQDVNGASTILFGYGGVGSDYGFTSGRVINFEHDMISDGETKELGTVGESEGEEARVW